MTTVHARLPARRRSQKRTVDLGHRVDAALDELATATSALRQARAEVMADGGEHPEVEIAALAAGMKLHEACFHVRYALLEMNADIRRYAGDPDTADAVAV